MGGISRRFWAVTLLLVAINVIGLLLIRQEIMSRPLPGLRLMSFSPMMQADDVDRITLRFDEPVMRVDQCNARLEHSPFVIEPAPPAGHWQWAEPDQLVYLLEEKLPAGRQFVIRPADDIETKIGRRIVGDAQFSFRTSALTWTQANVTSADGEHVTAELKFNQPVRPDDLLKHIKVLDKKSRTPLAVQVLTQTAAPQMIIRFPRPRDEQFQISIAGELTGDGGTLALGARATRDLQVSSVFKLRSAEVGSSRGGEPRIEVWFSQRLASDKPLPAGAVSVSPIVEDFNVFNAKNGDYLSLSGKFKSGSRYTVSVSANILSHEGKPLGSPQSLSIEIPDRDPMLRMPDSRGILSPRGNLTLDLKTCNVDAFTLSATKLHANNLVPHLRGDDEEATSRQIVERPIKLKSKKNEPVDVAIDLKQLLDKTAAAPGVYSISARAAKPYWLDDSSIVTISDLAITAKKQHGGYHVFITSLDTAKPLQNVKISAITYNNQTIAQGETDEQGIALLKASSSHPDGEIWLITAELGDDLNFIQPDRRQWVLDDIDQSGRAYPQTYDVMLYTERGVYRPGDVVHVTAVIREPNGSVPPPIPLTLRVKRPDGRMIAELPIPADTSGQGIVHADFASLADGQLGKYEFTVTLPGSPKPLGTTQALIEAFVPIRIEVKAAPSKARFGPDENPSVDVSARYLFGQPAAELPLTISPTLKSTSFASKRFAAFSFDSGEPVRKVEVETIEETLDSQGKSSSSFLVPIDELKGLWNASIVATVTEPGGRSVSQNSSALIDTINRHLGIQLDNSRVVQTDREQRVQWCFVDGSDQPVKAGRVRMRLERIEHDWVLQQVDGNAVWKSVERLILVKDERLKVDGATDLQSFSLTCKVPGNHRLTLTDEVTQATSRMRFYASNDANESTSPPVTSPERVELVLDKKAYFPGENAKVIVRSPFAGTLMLTVETNRVVQQFVLPMQENTAIVDVPVDAALRGSAFLSATVIRPLDSGNDKWLPHRAKGIARLITDHSANQPMLEIHTPQNAEPGESVAIQVETQPRASEHNPAVVHVWAVDDGILLTTHFRTPSPLDFYFALRASGVTTSDVFADLLPDHKRPAGMTRIGADGEDEEDSLRRSAVPMKQREAAVIWQTAQPMPADGRLSLNMTMPRITGRMRVMAVLVEGDKYASKQREITVASPLLVEASWPRFAAPGDVFDVPVKLFNATTSPLLATLSVDVTGPITLVMNDADRSVSVKPNEPRTIWLKAKATGLGEVKAIVRGSATSDSLGREVQGESESLLAVRPITPLHVESSLVRVKPGEAADVKRDGNFEPGTTRMTLSISGQPQVELRPAIEQLLDYPYGCLEQTTSRLMAILHAPQLLALESSDDARIEFANEAIAAGIARLWSMQTRSGGLSYWPGDTQPTLWGTTYASLFLVNAQRGGHRVDPKFTEEITKYLAEQLDRRDSQDNGPDANLRAMICHVLAAWNHTPHGWIARLSERVDDLDMAGRAHLAAAWHETGRTDRALAVLPAQTLGIAVKTRTSTEALTSPTRQDAMLLSVLLDLDRKHAWIPQLVRRVEATRQRGYWGTTLDNASAISALAKYQLMQPRDVSFTGRVMLADQVKHIFDHKMDSHLKIAELDVAIQIQTQGKGEAFVTVTTKGLLKADAIQPYERGLKLERRWLTREGKTIDPMALKVGDLIRVEVELSAPQIGENESIANVAMVDALPAGLEVENPRLSTSAAADDEAAARADRVEFLDDRVVLFTSVTKKPRVFRYMLRVTTVGRFAWPPLQADCMYDASLAAMGAKGQVIVTK